MILRRSLLILFLLRTMLPATSSAEEISAAGALTPYRDPLAGISQQWAQTLKPTEESRPRLRESPVLQQILLESTLQGLMQGVLHGVLDD